MNAAGNQSCGRRGLVVDAWRRLAAKAEPQRVAADLLHLVPAARRLLRAEHVRRRRRRELPQVSREPGEGGEGAARGEARQEDGAQAEKYGRPLAAHHADGTARAAAGRAAQVRFVVALWVWLLVCGRRGGRGGRGGCKPRPAAAVIGALRWHAQRATADVLVLVVVVVGGEGGWERNRGGEVWEISMAPRNGRSSRRS